MAFTFNIIEPVTVISEHNGWTREINVVSWNGGIPKVDIREWNSDHTRMSKGVTFTEDEAEKVAMALVNYISERRSK